MVEKTVRKRAEKIRKRKSRGTTETIVKMAAKAAVNVVVESARRLAARSVKTAKTTELT